MALTILLAGAPEDVAVLERAISRSPWDAHPEAATDGYRAVELTVRIRPTLIVVDPVLPGLAGPQLILRLRATAPNTPIICWAAAAPIDDVADLIRAGATAYLTKEDGAEQVVWAMDPVLAGGSVISPPVAGRLVARFAESVHRERELARALAEATMKIQEVTHAKAEFLANVSHELRTPVTIVKGIAHLLKERRLTPGDEAEFLQKMDRAVDRLTTLVDEILSIADLERGSFSFHVAPGDLVPLVGEVCDRIAGKYPRVTVQRLTPETLIAPIDPARFSEAVAQLVDNACRYSPEGKTVTVRLRLMDEGVVFSVTDSGTGLRREVASLAFHEPFVTGEEILRKERAGVGLGLHLARRIILLHGGIMWADPLPGGGTRVSFCIPSRLDAPVTRPPQGDEPWEPPAGGTPPEERASDRPGAAQPTPANTSS